MLPENSREKLSLVRKYPIETIFLLAIGGLIFFTTSYIKQGDNYRDYIMRVSEMQMKVIEANTQALKELKEAINNK